MRIKKSGFYLFGLGVLVLWSCANVVTPSGGNKDVLPPEAIKISPPNNSLNFNSKTVIFTFDEYIQLNNIQQQLLVSPPLKKQPEFVLKGKNLIMKSDQDLSPNTTYSFSFGDAIRDINEGNVLENFKYVVSTGSFIDSLFIRGTVVNSSDQKGDKGVLVMLYEDKSDSVPYLSPPSYFAQTNANGNFEINYMKECKYKLFALKDKNQDYLYNLPEESIGFIDSLISPQANEPAAGDSAKTDSVATTSKGKKLKSSSPQELKIQMFEEERLYSKPLKVFSPQYGKIAIVFGRPATDIKLVPLNNNFKPSVKKMEYSAEFDSVFYWFSAPGADSLIAEIREKDKIIDTIQIELKKLEDGALISAQGNKLGTGATSLQKVALTASTNLSIDSVLDLNKNLRIAFSHPIENTDLSQIIFTSGKDTILVNGSSEDETLRKFLFRFQWKYERNYRMFIPSGLFTDMLGFTNDSVIVEFKTLPEKNYGTLQLKYKLNNPSKGSTILQVLSEKNEKIAEHKLNQNGNIHFKNLIPQNYRLKVIEDADNNGRWTSGNYLEKKQPEKVILHPSGVAVKPNWDVELEWNIE